MNRQDVGFRVISARYPGIGWAAIIGITVAVTVANLSMLDGDAVFDWLTVRGVADGLGFGTPLGTLAQHYEVQLPPWFAAPPTYEEWIHPRTPGALLLVSPLLLADVQQAAAAGRLVSAATWIALAIYFTRRFSVFDSDRLGVWLVLVTASPPVLSLFDYAPHIGMVSVAIAAAWLGLRNGDSAGVGVLVGLAAVLRATFGLLIMCLLLAKKPKAAVAALLIWVFVEVGGMVAFGIPFGEAVAVSRLAAEMWIAQVMNGALLAQLVGLGIDLQLAVGLVLLLVVGTFVTLWHRSRKAIVPLDSWLAVGVTGAILASPVAWDQYLVLLLIPITWSMGILREKELVGAGTMIAASQLLLFWVRLIHPGTAHRGYALAIATVLMVAVVTLASLRAGASGGGNTSWSTAEGPAT